MSCKKIEKKANGGNIWCIRNTSSLTSTNTDGNISNTTSAGSTSSPKTTDITNPTSTKSGQTGKYQEKKEDKLVCLDPKKRGIEQTLGGKISSVGGVVMEFGGARGVTVIVAGCGHDDTSSNPGRAWMHFS